MKRLLVLASTAPSAARVAVFAFALVAVLVGMGPAAPAPAIAAVPTGGAVPGQIAQEEPAIVLEEPPPPVEDLPWTYRYLIPTGLALAALTLIATVVGYFVKVVRARYRIVR